MNCREWIKNLLEEVSFTADKLNMKHLLRPVYRVLKEGNQSMQWIQKFEYGSSIEEIMKFAIDDMVRREEEVWDQISVKKSQKLNKLLI